MQSFFPPSIECELRLCALFMTKFARELETPFQCGTAPLGFHVVYGVAGHEFLPRHPLKTQALPI